MLQLIFFCFSLQLDGISAFVCLILAGFFLCFTVHISFHELIHRTHHFERDHYIFYVGTLMIGLPLDGYRLHHLNHHLFTNTIGDYSSTWKNTPEGPKARNVWHYCLAWPYFIFLSRKGMKLDLQAGRTKASHQFRLNRQKIFFLLFTVSLLCFHKVFFSYLTMIYLGWVFTSLQNYGQHRPYSYEASQTYSCGDKVYNWILANNGLHCEHHSQPVVPWHKLTESRPVPRLNCPHIIFPFRSLNENSFHP
jgi:fatty acid desaturase